MSHNDIDYISQKTYNSCLRSNKNPTTDNKDYPINSTRRASSTVACHHQLWWDRAKGWLASLIVNRRIKKELLRRKSQ